MALGGVETGSIKPKLAPKVAPKAGGRGDTPADWAMAITTGTTILAEAVLEVVSLIKTAVMIAIRVIGQREDAPVREIIQKPSFSARPVENIRLPKVKPPPNNSMVPQSIRTASLQLTVNSLCFQLTGRTNNSRAARMAAAASGIWGL